MSDQEDKEPCWSCMGTGIGQHSQDSTCPKCKGRGYLPDEDDGSMMEDPFDLD